MTRLQGDIVTELIDLADCSLRDLRMSQSDDLTMTIQRVLRQVERPRANLGGSGPPGRAD
jgi:hypothetical protein